MAVTDRKFLASKRSLPSLNYNLEDAWKQYGTEDQTPEDFLEMVVSEIDKCRNDITYFAENYFYIISVDEGRRPIKLYDCQHAVLKSLVDNRFNVVAASRQVGKALDLDTPIPTPNGFVKMGDLKDGDYVLGLDGTPTKIIKAWDVLHNRKCYEIVFDNGEKIIADENHNWFTYDENETEGSVKTTKEIVDSGGIHAIPKSKGGDGWFVIEQINEVESRPVRCITVDAEDSLFLCGKSYIPTHNTTLTTIFVLWQAMFNKDQNIFVLANREATAKMILERIRLAYEEIPNWLKSSASTFSKTAIKFDNGSKISTSTTSVQGIRGQSANCVVLDEFAHVAPEVAPKFYEAIWPTIASSRTAKIIMLSTPNGASNIFYEMYSKAELGEGNKEWNGWKASQIMWDEIPRYNEKGEIDYEGYKRAQIAGFGGNIDSWLQEFCCVFHDKGAAAINMSLLQELKKKVRKPIYTFEDGDYLVWEDRQPGHIYSIGVDTSEGVGVDFSVAQILDITDLTDIRLVGQYHSNVLQPYVFAERLNKVARGWGNPFLAIERNGPGGQVIDALYEIHKYNNIINYTMKNDKRGMYQKAGIFCHTNSKYTGIMNMKYWVENLRAVSIPDSNTLREYETFRRKENGTWKAKDGHHDDRIMAMIWALIPLETKIAQKYFSILQYDDVGKPKIIKDPNAEFSDYLGPLWDTSNMGMDSSVGLGDPAFSGFGSMDHGVGDLYKTHNGVIDIGVQGWTIL